jgi:glycerol-3-phosphate dehydrogenase (NAD(P)+)
MTMVAEGVETCRSVHQLSTKHKIDTPIANAVYKILFEDRDATKVTYELMTRDMKAEDE